MLHANGICIKSCHGLAALFYNTKYTLYNFRYTYVQRSIHAKSDQENNTHLPYIPSCVYCVTASTRAAYFLTVTPVRRDQNDHQRNCSELRKTKGSIHETSLMLEVNHKSLSCVPFCSFWAVFLYLFSKILLIQFFLFFVYHFIKLKSNTVFSQRNTGLY